jgi:hypothetical protein
MPRPWPGYERTGSLDPKMALDCSARARLSLNTTHAGAGKIPAGRSLDATTHSDIRACHVVIPGIDGPMAVRWQRASARGSTGRCRWPVRVYIEPIRAVRCTYGGCTSNDSREPMCTSRDRGGGEGGAARYRVVVRWYKQY